MSDPIYSVVYSFDGGSDGASPEAPLIDVNGLLYSTTYAGGAFGDGTVFSFTPSADSESVLYTFGSKPDDGEAPLAGLREVNGALWGTTNLSTNAPTECGAVFKLTTAGVEQIKHLFNNSPDGCHPTIGSLVKSGALLYGTTSYGGDSRGDGVIFQISTAGQEQVDYAFAGQPDGSDPSPDLTDVSGTFYGTTFDGGSKNGGTIYSFSPPRAVKIVYDFGVGSDGAGPTGGLLDVDGTLYGTTRFGGTTNRGTLFRFTIAGGEKVLYNFGATSSDGVFPGGDLIARDGILYGTTPLGGAANIGTVYSMTKRGGEKILHSFGSMSGDGGHPEAGLLDVQGTFYGTAGSGGSQGDGAVYSIVP